MITSNINMDISEAYGDEIMSGLRCPFELVGNKFSLSGNTIEYRATVMISDQTVSELTLIGIAAIDKAGRMYLSKQEVYEIQDRQVIVAEIPLGIYTDLTSSFMNKCCFELSFFSLEGKYQYKVGFLNHNDRKIGAIGSIMSERDKEGLVAIRKKHCLVQLNEKKHSVAKNPIVKVRISDNQNKNKNFKDVKKNILNAQTTLTSSVEFKNDSFNTNVDTFHNVSLDNYKKAIRDEIKYLSFTGGRKYKVSNGRPLGLVGGAYAYVFESDTELHLSDDSPIRVELSGCNTKGHILGCEDFQIMVCLDAQ